MFMTSNFQLYTIISQISFPSKDSVVLNNWTENFPREGRMKMDFKTRHEKLLWGTCPKFMVDTQYIQTG